MNDQPLSIKGLRACECTSATPAAHNVWPPRGPSFGELMTPVEAAQYLRLDETDAHTPESAIRTLKYWRGDLHYVDHPNTHPTEVGENHHNPAQKTSPWLSVEQIRKQQRMRREYVIAAMLSGELPYEQRGRIRYARQCDVNAWEEKRLKRGPVPKPYQIHPDLAPFL